MIFFLLRTKNRGTWKRQSLLLYQDESQQKTPGWPSQQKNVLIDMFTSNVSLKLIQYNLIAALIQVKLYFFITEELYKFYFWAFQDAF